MDTVDPLRFILAFVLVLGLIGCMAFVLKRINGAKVLSAGKDGRISVVESRWLDPKRRLVLVKRDEQEHLLLLADGRETVIETIAPKDKAHA